MINKFIRYIKGYLRIRISGNAVERFLNACSYKGIILWDLTPCNLCYEANIMLRDFKTLKPVIRKTHTKVCIVNRTGFPFLIQKYHKRRLFFIGFLFCIMLMYYLSTFIWDIRITGNQTCTTETLIEFLKTIDVEQGMKRKDLSCNDIVAELRKHFDDIIWASASINGSNLMIQIKENSDSIQIPEIKNNTSVPYDIVSDTDCIITKIIIRSGLTHIKEGDTIKKGTVLVSGHIPVLNDAKEVIDYQSVISDADIYGKVTINYENERNLTNHQKHPETIQKTEYYLQIGSYRLGFGSIKNNYKTFTEYSKQQKIAGIYAGVRTAIPYSSVKKQYSDTEIQQILSADFIYYCKELEKKGVVILENNVKIYTWSDTAKAIGTITVEMPVGQLKKSEFIEIGETIDGNDGNND